MITDSSNVNNMTDMSNPFRTFSNLIYPRTVQHTHIWALWLWNRFDLYRKSVQNVVRYFINDISVTQETSHEQVDADFVAKATRILKDDYDLLNMVRKAGEELAAIGIVFISVMNKVDRYLVCPECGAIHSIKSMRKGQDYTWENFEFHGVCGKCHKHVKFDRRDQTVSTEPTKLMFKTWPQDDIRIRYNQITNTAKYYYEIPDDIAKDIRMGDEVYLEDTEWTFIEAVKNNCYVELDNNRTLCLKTDNLAMLEKRFKGWAPPLFLPSFPHILQLQMLERFNEAIAMDYIVPIRLLSPAPQVLQAGADSMRAPMSGAVIRKMLMSMVRQSRNNPTTWFTSPIPLNYQMIGGEAKALAPVELLEWKYTQLLSGMSIPMEFKQTSFQMVGPTIGLRMFERMWTHFSRNLDILADWMAKQVGRIEQWEPVKVTLNKTSFVEDEVNKNTRINLMAGGQISKETGLSAVGIDYAQEQRKIMEETLTEADRQAAMQTKMQQKGAYGEAMAIPPVGAMQATSYMQNAMAEAQGGGAQEPQGAVGAAAPMAPAGASMPTPGGTPEDPGSIIQEAQNIAQQLFSAPYAVRRSELSKIKSTNETLYAQVKVELEKISTQAASQGVQQARQGG